MNYQLLLFQIEPEEIKMRFSLFMTVIATLCCGRLSSSYKTYQYGGNGNVNWKLANKKYRNYKISPFTRYYFEMKNKLY